MKSRSGSISEIGLQQMEKSLRRAQNLGLRKDKIKREREALKKWQSEVKLKQKEGRNPLYLQKKEQ
ncbi:uncharacterized protein MELLADRAFT_86249 [Melampsora larici-populina 98AG31]|uniref:Uncharacterized protein n=1 Tax=Melampsora larici-populina (strain 98AG31 / pathotype 3-4-7) TaxID=747676 RepID=F4RL32_MELLP|nr:uncharacterized protein MELLADRAFT_86249 [Melampsora larici-populina 98AG31]EGG06833.1 hypothetical protein MELLADRAFT_86249 [Melampsora larici-populina 98AG31]